MLFESTHVTRAIHEYERAAVRRSLVESCIIVMPSGLDDVIDNDVIKIVCRRDLNAPGDRSYLLTNDERRRVLRLLSKVNDTL